MTLAKETGSLKAQAERLQNGAGKQDGRPVPERSGKAGRKAGAGTEQESRAEGRCRYGVRNRQRWDLCKYK